MEKLYKISLKNSMLMGGMIDFHDDLVFSRTYFSYIIYIAGALGKINHLTVALLQASQQDGNKDTIFGNVFLIIWRMVRIFGKQAVFKGRFKSHSRSENTFMMNGSINGSITFIID